MIIAIIPARLRPHLCSRRNNFARYLVFFPQANALLPCLFLLFIPVCIDLVDVCRTLDLLLNNVTQKSPPVFQYQCSNSYNYNYVFEKSQVKF